MTVNTRHRLVTRYLATLEAALHDMPRRAEILEDVTEHLDAAVAEAAQGGPVTSSLVRRVLERMGDPQDIAREALDDTPPPPPRSYTVERLTIALLLVPFFLPGWIVGAILLWGSPVWRREDKILGTLLFPGGILFALPLWLLGNTVLSFVGFPVDFDIQDAVVLCLAGSVYTATRLTRRLRKARELAM